MQRAITTLAAAATAALAAQASAALIASDSFSVDGTPGNGDYNVGNLNDQNPTVGLTGFVNQDWRQSNGGATGDVDVEMGGLTAALVPGTTLPGNVRSDGNPNNARGIYHELASVPSSDSYFFSFVLSSEYGNSMTLGLTPIGGFNSGDYVDGVSVGVDDNGAGTGGNDLVFRVESGRIVLIEDYDQTTTYFALVEIANDDAGTDTITASIYSDSTLDLSSPLATATTTGEVTADLTHLAFKKQDNLAATGGAKFDEFRFGTEIADVTAIPEPASAGLIGLGGILLAARRRRA